MTVNMYYPKLKPSHKNLMFEEGAFLYCIRHNLNIDFDEFIKNIFLSDVPVVLNNNEFDRICSDLRHFRSKYMNYDLIEISVEEYDLCVQKFGMDS